MADVPPIIAELVERYDRNRDMYRSDQYNEEQTRIEFINPFFEALDWNVTNKVGHSPKYMDVVFEGTFRIDDQANAPDYTFRIGEIRKFFVEAKKPSKSINLDQEPAHQIRRYSWTAKLPLGIVTNFHEFAVYDGRIPPKTTDKAAYARLTYLTYKDYLSRWDEIANVFSHDALWKGSFDKYAEQAPKMAGTAEVDDQFLKQIEEWRRVLAHNLALRNRLEVTELNYAVQTTIDRIVFLRICEDRGMESEGQLLGLLNGHNIYGRLLKLYYDADEKYNSGLFHFREEKARPESPDRFTPGLAVDDKVLKEIISGLYRPKSPYAFSVISADILGNVYEQFLGKVIVLKSPTNATVEEKPEVKKAGGVYYTPTYIVDYIVQNTVGKLCEGKNPKQVSKLRIVDPACGSGSFLISAYSRLINWHLDCYVRDGPEKHEKEIRQVTGRQWRLTTKEKKRILLNNIYGVDIDSQAVEVTKLSLLLKVLEGESAETISNQLRLLHERALPDLGNNIKCGNSLIGCDFFEGRPPDEISYEERSRINAFDWNREFADIINAGGFDAVIGNPPWGADFREDERGYLRKKYARIVARMIDSYLYFIDGTERITKAAGEIGLIVPSTVLNQIDAKPARRLLLQRGLSDVISLGQGIFGPKVLNTSTIVVSGQRQEATHFTLVDLSYVAQTEKPLALAAAGPNETWAEWKALVERDPDCTFFVGKPMPRLLLDRLRCMHPPLAKALDGSIERGVSPDISSAHVISVREAQEKGLELELLRPSVGGTKIKRYQQCHCDQYLIYTTRDVNISEYPLVEEHLGRYRHLNTCKEVTQGKHAWWVLHRPRNPAIFASPKLIGLTTSRTIELCYDESECAYVTDAMYVFRALPSYDPWVMIAVLQSKLLLFLYRVANQSESRVIPQVKASKLQNLPYPDHRGHQLSGRLAQVCKGMYDLHKKLPDAKTPDEKTRIQRQIEVTDRQIDALVYELYGLTEEEIKIVEEAT